MTFLRFNGAVAVFLGGLLEPPASAEERLRFRDLLAKNASGIIVEDGNEKDLQNFDWVRKRENACHVPQSVPLLPFNFDLNPFL